jgi:hypothetical protein
MNGMDNRQEEMRTISMNLRKIRNALLLSEENVKKPYDFRGSLRYDLEEALDKLTALPKKLSYVSGNGFDNNKAHGLDILKHILPSQNSEILDWAIKVRSNQGLYKELIFNLDDLIILNSLEKVVTGYEEIIKSYIENYPK